MGMNKIIEVEVKTGSKFKKFEIIENGGKICSSNNNNNNYDNNNNNNDITENVDKIKLYITERPINNKANEAIIKYLSEIFNTPKKNIEIIKGLKIKNKLVKITF
ncbi:MAG: DUF167 domain-containing protein [Candidatus Acididesulfobacter guangdongensis]|uniref:DUF167 domain-containing protein n=1 Tax=Acididesulfobacter guangdongensis TaxID=2597225 RepID=A0A519BJ56_ACIG2|nr:MAG: DUF167 domain-containing protein [Candidatus Acididesulfobacter guangdongensis]